MEEPKRLSAPLTKNNIQIYIKNFQDILREIVFCYRKMIANEVKLKNNENKIRNELLGEYLKKEKKTVLGNYIFNAEALELETSGEVDIKIEYRNSYTSEEPYYIIECKRLNNKTLTKPSGLNGKYIEKGIMRFVTEYYSSHYGTNGMIGFVVEKMDIDKNVDNINDIIKNYFHKTNTTQKLTKENFINNFEFHYSSKHKVSNGKNKEITLYHLMLDFSDNII